MSDSQNPQNRDLNLDLINEIHSLELRHAAEIKRLQEDHLLELEILTEQNDQEVADLEARLESQRGDHIKSQTFFGSVQALQFETHQKSVRELEDKHRMEVEALSETVKRQSHEIAQLRAETDHLRRKKSQRRGRRGAVGDEVEYLTSPR